MTRSWLLGFAVIALALQPGCAADSADLEEDAVAADPASGAKVDEAGFVTGHYFNSMWQEVEGEPLIAIFHPADGSEPAGFAGRFDLSRNRGDYEFEYLSGYYKLYTYRGTARLRLADAAGKVLGRYEWSYADRTLVLDGHELTRAPSPAADELVECLVVDVLDPSAYEESLSMYEYPDVSIQRDAAGQVALWIGGSLLDAPDHTITVEEQGGAITATATRDGFRDVIRVPAGPLRRGEILTAAPDEELAVVARIVCQ